MKAGRPGARPGVGRAEMGTVVIISPLGNFRREQKLPHERNKMVHCLWKVCICTDARR